YLEALVLVHEGHRVARVHRGDRDVYVHVELAGSPSTLYASLAAYARESEHVPLLGARRGRRRRDVRAEHEGVLDLRRKPLEVPGRSVVRRLGLEEVVEEQRLALRAPAAPVGQAPDRHAREVVGVPAEDVEGFLVVVTLLDDLRVRARPDRHVELCDSLLETETMQA